MAGTVCTVPVFVMGLFVSRQTPKNLSGHSDAKHYNSQKACS